MIAEVWASFVRLVGREADEREKGTRRPRSPSQPRGPRGKRQADRSDVRQEFARLKQARTGFEPWTSGRAPALHASRVSHDPCLQDLSLPFRSCEADAAAFRRARDNAFHPATDHHSRFRLYVKKLRVNMVNRKRRRRRLSRWRSGFVPIACWGAYVGSTTTSACSPFRPEVREALGFERITRAPTLRPMRRSVRPPPEPAKDRSLIFINACSIPSATIGI